jgi:hypothetical protein
MALYQAQLDGAPEWIVECILKDLEAATESAAWLSA